MITVIKSLETKVVITIPEELVLVEKAEYQKLVDERDQGKIEDLKWFKKQVGIENLALLKERILYPYRKELEKFVKYPEEKGVHWKFHKAKTKEWIENNFDKVVGR